MRIGVIGGGTVGRAVARCYVEHYDVRVYDILRERSTHSLKDTLDVREDGLVFVCLPTPARMAGGYASAQREDENGLCIRALHGFFYSQAGSTTNFVLRSTVPIGTTRQLLETYDIPELVHSPEFLTARCAVTDAQLPARNIVGGGVCRCSITLGNLYAERFPGVQVKYMSSDASEAVKLLTNAFFAVKIAYFNEARSICDKLGLSWQAVLGGILSDGRISHSHTQVPGPDGSRGFGGECLPKDLMEVVDTLDRLGLSGDVVKGVVARNTVDRGAGKGIKCASS